MICDLFFSSMYFDKMLKNKGIDMEIIFVNYVVFNFSLFEAKDIKDSTTCI